MSNTETVYIGKVIETEEKKEIGHQDCIWKNNRMFVLSIPSMY